MEEAKIRCRVTYRIFREFADFLEREPTNKEILEKLYSTLDERKAFGYEHVAVAAQSSMELVIKDKGLA